MILLVGASNVSRANETLSPDAIASAIAYFGAVIDRPLAEDDQDWLRRQWQNQFLKTPVELAERLDDFFVQYKLHQRDADPRALALSRQQLIDAAYCAAEQTGDPDSQRLGDILAPKDLILAADCALGLVVTRFDLEGLVASHGLTASITGVPFDAESNREGLGDWLDGEFSESDPAFKALAAAGEVRHATAARFWSLLQGDPKREEIAAALRPQASDDLHATARQLEQLALEQIASLDYLAAAGGYRVTRAEIDEHLKWVGYVSGGALSLRDRVWIEDVAIRKFLKDPETVSGWFAEYRQANRDYAVEEDWTRRSEMVNAWAAGAYCYLAEANDPEDRHTLEIIFRANPVVDSDCGAKRIERLDDVVVAEADGLVLTEGDLKASRTWMAFIFGRGITSEEAAHDRRYMLERFSEEPAKMIENIQQTRTLLAENERRDLAFLKEEHRRQMVINFYCHYQGADDADGKAFVAMFERNNDVLLVDCDQRILTTRDDVDAALSSFDFLASLAGLPPFTAEERAERHEGWANEALTYAAGNRIAFSEWWSMIDLGAKQDAIGQIRSGGFSHAQDVAPKMQEWIDHAKLTAVLLDAKQEQCALMAVISRGNVAIYAAESGRDFSEAFGFAGGKYAYYVTTNDMFSAFCS